MNEKNNIQNKIDKLINSTELIAKVKSPPFFKDKTLQILYSEKDENQKTFLWFTPKLQLATLLILILINVIVYLQYNTFSYDNQLDSFAENYGFMDNDNSLPYDNNLLIE